MDCTTLGSSRVPLKANYMLGVLKEDGLYLNPLKGISQLRYRPWSLLCCLFSLSLSLVAPLSLTTTSLSLSLSLRPSL